MDMDSQRYEAALHAIQTGVKFDIEKAGENAAGADPKHLRTGVNSAFVSIAAIEKLLIAKGIITPEEWGKAIADSAEKEKERYVNHIKDKYGIDVTLV